MFGEVGTVSEDTNGDANNALDATESWDSSSVDSSAPIATWGPGWVAETASPNGWDIAAPDEPASPINRFAGWGALGSTDSSPVTHDLSEWDSPSDAAVVQAAASPWVLASAAEVPQWSANWAAAPVADPPAWPAESAWATARVADSPERSVETEQATDHDASTVAALSGGATSMASASWLEIIDPSPDVADDLADLANRVDGQWANDDTEDEQPTEEAAEAMNDDSEDEQPTEDTAEVTNDIWADAPAAPTLPASFLTGTIDAERFSSGVAFHEIAAAHAAVDSVPLAERTTPAPLASLRGNDSQDESEIGQDATPKRRGRLAARMARETLAQAPANPTEESTALVHVENAAALDGHSTHADNPVRKPRASFFAKREPQDVADAGNESRDTPKVLRIAALVSLLVGLGLFAFTVINGGSSDSTPEIAPTVPAATVIPSDLTPAIAPTPEVTTPVATDPIFGADEPIRTAPIPAETPTDDLSFSDPGDFSN